MKINPKLVRVEATREFYEGPPGDRWPTYLPGPCSVTVFPRDNSRKAAQHATKAFQFIQGQLGPRDMIAVATSGTAKPKAAAKRRKAR